MSITVVREGNVLRILSSSAPIPENITLELEVKTSDPWDLAQLDSVFSEDEEDWGKSLDALRLPPLHAPIRK
jgi:hypothetical protein